MPSLSFGVDLRAEADLAWLCQEPVIEPGPGLVLPGTFRWIIDAECARELLVADAHLMPRKYTRWAKRACKVFVFPDRDHHSIDQLMQPIEDDWQAEEFADEFAGALSGRIPAGAYRDVWALSVNGKYLQRQRTLAMALMLACSLRRGRLGVADSTVDNELEAVEGFWTRLVNEAALELWKQRQNIMPCMHMHQSVGIGRLAGERLQAAHISFALGSIHVTQAAHKRIAMGDNVRWLMENCEQFHQSEWDMAADLKFRFADIGDDDDSSDEAPLALVTPHQPCSNSHCTFAATVQHRPFCCMQCGKAVKSNRKLSIHGVKCLKKPALRNRDQDRRSRSPRPRKMPKELKEPKKELTEPKPGPAQPPFPPNLRQGLHRGSGKASNTPPPTRGGHDRGSDAHEKASRVHRKLKSEPTEDDDRGRSQARAEAKPVMPLKREAGDAGAALAAHKRGREELLCKMSESHDFLGIAKNLNSDNGFGFASNKLVIDMLHKDLWFCLFDSPRGSANLGNGDLITFKAVIGQDSRIKATNINLVMPTWQEVRWLHLPHRMVPGLSLHLPILWELHCGNLVAAVAVVSSGRFTNDSHNGAPMGAAMWRCRDGAMAQRCFLCFPNYGPTGLFILRTSSSGAFVSLD